MSKQSHNYILLKTLAITILVLALGGEMTTSDTHTECGVAQTAFGMCVPYVLGQDPQLSSQCCQGVQSVHSLATTAESQKRICQCLRLLLLSLGTINSARASTLSSQCGTSSSSVIPTTLSFDCTKLA